MKLKKLVSYFFAVGTVSLTVLASAVACTFDTPFNTTSSSSSSNSSGSSSSGSSGSTTTSPAATNLLFLDSVVNYFNNSAVQLYLSYQMQKNSYWTSQATAENNSANINITFTNVLSLMPTVTQEQALLSFITLSNFTANTVQFQIGYMGNTSGNNTFTYTQQNNAALTTQDKDDQTAAGNLTNFFYQTSVQDTLESMWQAGGEIVSQQDLTSALSTYLSQTNQTSYNAANIAYATYQYSVLDFNNTQYDVLCTYLSYNGISSTRPFFFVFG